MNTVAGFFQDIGNLISTIGFADIVDILIVAYLIYKVIDLIRKTSSYNLARGLLVLLIALWLSGMFKLAMINYLLRIKSCRFTENFLSLYYKINLPKRQLHIH